MYATERQRRRDLHVEMVLYLLQGVHCQPSSSDGSGACVLEKPELERRY